MRRVSRFWKAASRAGRSAAVLMFVAAVMLAGCSDCESVEPLPDAAETRDGSAAGEAGVGDVRDTGLRRDTGASDTGPDVASDTGWEESSSDAAADIEGDVDHVQKQDTEVDSPVCGDGDVEGDEACDDGNIESGDYCAPDCSHVTGRCGDGMLQANESCDDGELESGCDTYHDGGDGTCQPPGECSDGYVTQDGTCVAKQRDEHVHIYISNTCDLSVSPQRVEVARG